MQQTDTQIREDVFREALEFRRGGFQFLLRFFDDGIDDVGLTPGGDFAADEFPHAQELIFFAPAGFDGRAARRHFVNHGNFQVAVERERERARDRCCGHHEYVGRNAFVYQAFALQNTEAVLFVHDDETEFLEGYGILDQRMGADDNLRRAAFDAREGFIFGGSFCAR